jgi:VanZ family protein
VRPKLAAVLALALMLTIVFLSSQSHLDIPGDEFDGRDKLGHAGIYALLAALYTLTARVVSRRAAVVAIVAAVLFGATDEIHQSFVPGRDASWLDLLADTVGAAIGASIVTWYGARRWPARSSPSAASDRASPTTSSSPITPP